MRYCVSEFLRKVVIAVVIVAVLVAIQQLEPLIEGLY
jgi:hypothetical protein